MNLTTQMAHGGLDMEELRSLGIDPRQVLDFSASINPLGPPPGVRKALAQVDIAAYPDRRCLALREAMAAHLAIEPSQVLVGNGSVELIHLLARSYLSTGDRALIFSPTFGEYEAACRGTDAHCSALRAEEAQGFRWPIDIGLTTIKALAPRLVFLCNPNNPTGVYLDKATVYTIAQAMRDDGILVLDEAYLAFTEARWDSLPLLKLGNVILLHSMTKDYALAGLRVGYMLAPPQVVHRVSPLQPSWSVNAAAQAAALAALQDGQHLEKAMETVRRGKAYLEQELRNLGLEVLPSSANFLLAKVGDAPGLRIKLLRHGVCVRDCTSFGLPRYIRIGVRRVAECRRLVATLKEVLPDE